MDYPGGPVEVFVPGRVCLFGEHSDWAGGYRRQDPGLEPGSTLIAGTDQGIRAEVERHDGALVLTTVVPEGRGAPRVIPLDAGALRAEAEGGGFWSYVAGTAAELLCRHRIGGLRLENRRMDLPVRKGLFSSAAACVLTARAFNRLYDLDLSVRDEMELAYQGELRTGSRCGRMDQGCAFGGRPVRMEFDGDRVEVEEIPPGRDLHLLVVDLRARKDTKRILSRLNAAYPAAPGEVARGVRELLGPVNRRLVGEAVDALRAGDAERLGRLMVEAQERFDRLAMPACPEELTAPILHRVLAHDGLRPHVWGGKGVGSQGDGSAQFVARSPKDREAAVRVVERELGMTALRVTLRAGAGAETEAGAGAAAS